MTRQLPPTASVAHADEGSKLHAPAAARNADALTEVLRDHAPANGQALEIASGTGQHVVAFAAALPGLSWQPSDIDAARRASIDAHAQESGLENIAPAIDLNAATAGWSKSHDNQDLIVVVNLLHLISTEEVQTVIMEAAKALRSGGKLIIYGPFRRDGQLTSEGDQRFDAELRSADPAIGYKDTAHMREWLTDVGLTSPILQEMPANNLVLISEKAP